MRKKILLSALVIISTLNTYAQSGVSKSVEAGKAVTGSLAYDYTSALRSQAVNRRLPELEKKIKELETLLKQALAEKV